MKKISILVVIIIFYFAESCSTLNKMNVPNITANVLHPDSTVKAILGDKAAKIIFTPDSVKCYYLNSLVKPTKTTETVAGYTIDVFAGNVGKDYIAILQFLIQNKTAFANDTLIKECRFTPNYAFDFYKEKDKATILISIDCDMFGFASKDKTLVTKDIAHPEILRNFVKPIEKLVKAKKNKKEQKN